MNPEEPLSVRSDEPAGIGDDVRDQQDLWEKIFSRQNLMVALKRGERNRGAAGVDGLGADELRAWCLEHWVETRAALDAGTYAPLPVRQVMIPKPDGGPGMLGVPSVLDRLIQQAIAQVLSPVFDQVFRDRGHRFVRYADDIRVFVKSKRAAQRVLVQATKVLESELKLRVNRGKSVINPASVATLLGFGFYFTKTGVKIKVVRRRSNA